MTPVLLIVIACVLACVVGLFVLRQNKGQPKQPPKPPIIHVNGTSKVKQPEQEVDSNKPSIRILYGTQTGTAERFSKQLGNELRKKYGDSTAVEVVDIENYKASDRLHKEKLVVFCVATYGDGEPTDNAADFYGWLLKEAEAVENGDRGLFLQGVSYGVFGLGNKQYEHFNAVGRKMFKALAACGANAVCRRGDGDDDGVIDDDFDKWCADLFAALDSSSDLVGNKVDQKGGEAAALVAAYDVELLPSSTAEASPFPQGIGKDHHSPFWAKVTTVRELHTSQSDRSCVHAEISTVGSQISYQAGDHVAIYAQNSAAVVQEVAQLLGQPLDTVFRLKQPADSNNSNKLEAFPGPLSLRTALSYFADVLASPHKEALEALSAFASNPDESSKLRLLSSQAGKQQYAEYIGKPKRSLLEVMREHPSCHGKVPLGAFFACIAPRLQPRYYSISSSSRLHPQNIHVTCAVVNEQMPTGRIHEGLCSTWLQQHALGAVAPVFVRHSHFRLPADPRTPIVMVGPGTGLAPFRGFLQERSAMKHAGTALGTAHLFFGCRSRAMDYIYQSELEGYLAEGAITNLHVAFSRDQAEKDYVQHHLQRQASAVWPLLAEQGGYLYVCGDAKYMAKDVHRTLVSMAQQMKGCTGTQAEAWVKELSDSGRYQRDVW